MRKILFRGKRIDNGEWVYGSFCMDALEQFNGLCGVDGFIRLYDKDRGRIQTHEVDRESVGQYTGLKDKNGKCIFEGDIIHFVSYDYYDCDYCGYVVFNDGCFCIKYKSEIAKKFGWSFSFHRIGEIETFVDHPVRGTITYSYDVIGNIYDNPEMCLV